MNREEEIARFKKAANVIDTFIRKELSEPLKASIGCEDVITIPSAIFYAMIAERDILYEDIDLAISLSHPTGRAEEACKIFESGGIKFLLDRYRGGRE